MVTNIESANPQSIGEIRKLIEKHQLNNPQSQTRSLLIKGLDVIKGRIEYNNKLKEAGNISLDVNQMGGWISNLVRDTLGGKINSTKQTIMWEIDGKIIEYNPYDGSLGYAD